jgi:hypothetical protein
LLQQFRTISTAGIVGGGSDFAHYAPWFVNNARLYRFFEFAGTHDYFAAPPGTGGVVNSLPTMAMRKPGMININTVWDPEILRALIGTNDTVANTIFTQMIAQRTPGLTGTPPNIGPTDGHMAVAPAGYSLDRPFRSLATGSTAASVVTAAGGQYPTATGINNTILAPIVDAGVINTDTRAKTAFDSAASTTHPYVRHEWLTKMFNSITTRSNVFAVFVTVGFFEVKDDTTRPVKLGAEIGRADNRHIRHRMFAIVDRSDLRINLANPTNPQQAVGLQTAAPIAVPVGQTLTVTERLPAGWTLTIPTTTGAQFTIQPGTVVVYDPDTVNEEILTVTAVNAVANPKTFTVTMRLSHAQGTPIVFRGNPGPWANYSPRLDRRVVPYFSIID